MAAFYGIPYRRLRPNRAQTPGARSRTRHNQPLGTPGRHFAASGY